MHTHEAQVGAMSGTAVALHSISSIPRVLVDERSILPTTPHFSALRLTPDAGGSGGAAGGWIAAGRPAHESNESKSSSLGIPLARGSYDCS